MEELFEPSKVFFEKLTVLQAEEDRYVDAKEKLVIDEHKTLEDVNPAITTAMSFSIVPKDDGLRGNLVL